MIRTLSLLLLFLSRCDAQNELSADQRIGIGVGASMAVLLLAAVIFVLCRRWRNNEGRSRLRDSVTETSIENHENLAASLPVSDYRGTEASTQTWIEETHGACDKSSVSVQTASITMGGSDLVSDNRTGHAVETQESSCQTSDENVAKLDGKSVSVQTSEISDDSEPVEGPLDGSSFLKSRDSITFVSGWRREVKLTELIKARLIHETRVQELEREEVTEEDIEKELEPFLIGRYPIAGVSVTSTGEKMSLNEAFTKGFITRGTAVSLLEAQAAVGSILDPRDGAKMSVAKAKEIGLIDKRMAGILVRAEKAVAGFKARATNEMLSLFQAMKRNLVVESHGIRLLEAQIATGGIIDPVAQIRLPVEVAFERGLFDERLHQILEDPSDDTKGFLDPNTGENLTYLELLQRCVEDEETGLLLLPLIPKEEISDYYNTFANTSYLSSPTHSYRSFSSSSETTSLDDKR